MSLERAAAGSDFDHDGEMKTLMKLEDLNTVDQLTSFLSGTQSVAFSIISDKGDCYRWIQGELVRFRYLSLSRREKGVVMRYLMKISGYSRQQLTRLITQYRKTGRLQRHQRTVSSFIPKYTEADIRLLVAMDERHDTPCGRQSKSCVSGPVRFLGRRSTPRWHRSP